MTWQIKLIRWYRKNKRDLPWRRTNDPYKIWLSEIMLQQTTVETVIPYYQRFLKKFPTLTSLASGSEETALRLWLGLGYYSRARNLHRAAQIIAKEFKGRLPQTVEELQKLPGIGRYTAGAIASIAFGKRAPILDGNVIRVLSRRYALKKDPKGPIGQKVFWQRAEEILPATGCGDFNQALMELGATVCQPGVPLCELCPVAKDCRARREGNPTAYPKAGRRVEYKKENWIALLIEKNGRLLLTRRPNHGLLKGMWEFPMITTEPPLPIVRKLRPVRHSILNRRLTIRPIVCRPANGRLPYFTTATRWVKPKEFRQLPTSSMNQKLLATFLEADR